MKAQKLEGTIRAPHTYLYWLKKRGRVPSGKGKTVLVLKEAKAAALIYKEEEGFFQKKT